MEENTDCRTKEEEEDDDSGRLLSCYCGRLDADDILVRFSCSEVLRIDHGDVLVELEVRPWGALGRGKKKQRKKGEGEREKSWWW